MKRYEYFQETAESVNDDNWQATLYKHGNQGWELCAVNHENTYKKQRFDEPAEKAQIDHDPMQKIYIITFKREL